jgi:glycosyltransferase involved in cell wall biosynthesis
MKIKDSDICVIIPVYNEEKRIRKVLDDLLTSTDCRIVVVDDGSTDKTFAIASNIKKVIVLRHKINQVKSKGAAMKTGCEYAFDHLHCKAVIFMDGDGQHLPSDLPKFIEKLGLGYDIILGSRNFNLNIPLVRYLGNKTASIVINLLFSKYVSDLLCGFRAITKTAYEQIKWDSVGYGVETEMVVNMARTNLRWCEVPVTVLYYDKAKGVSILDAFGILFDVIKWRFFKG